MSLKAVKLLTGRNAPTADRIITARCDDLAISREGQGIQPRGGRWDVEDFLTRAHFPQAKRPLRYTLGTGFVGNASQDLAVSREDEPARNVPLRHRQCQPFLIPSYVQEHDA